MNSQKGTCTCNSLGQTSLAPAAFDPHRVCLTHFDQVEAAASIRAIGASEFRATQLSVEYAVALLFALPGTRKRTTENYATQARRLINFHGGQMLADLKPHDLADDLEEIRRNVVDRSSEESRCGNGDGAAESYLAFVRALYKKLAPFLPPGTGNPASAVTKKKRQPLRRREHYSQIQLAMIFTSVLGHPEGQLFLLMLYLIRTTGIRRSSLVGLNLEDIDFATGETAIRGKGGCLYWVYIAEDLRREILVLHQRHRGLSDAEMAAVIDRVVATAANRYSQASGGSVGYDVRTGVGGTHALWTRRGKPISRKTAERLIAAVQRRLSEGAVVHFDLHSLRHTFIAQVRDNFGPDAAAGVAGHRNRQTASAEATGDYTLTRGAKHLRIFRWMFPAHRFGIADVGQA